MSRKIGKLKKPKLVVDTKALHVTFDPSISREGFETTFYNMLSEFSKYWDRIDILCPKVEGGKERVIHKNVYVHPSPWSFAFQTLFIVKKGGELNKEHGHDLIILHSGPPFIMDWGAFYLSKIFKIPCIPEIHHIVGHPKTADVIESIGRRVTQAYLRYASKHALAIRVVNSKDSLPFLLRCGVPRSKILVLPSFYINFDIFKPIKVKKTTDIVFAGRLVKNKGIFELLSATKLVSEKYPDIKVKIIGSGPLKKKIEKRIWELGISKNVKLIGWLPTLRDVARVYNESAMMVVTSYNEGGPRVALEAMACSIPVISTRVGIMKEVIKEGENGLFTSWNPREISSKIIHLLANDDERKRMGRAAEKTVQKFEFKKMIKNYALAYQQLISGEKNE